MTSLKPTDETSKKIATARAAARAPTSEQKAAIAAGMAQFANVSSIKEFMEPSKNTIVRSFESTAGNLLSKWFFKSNTCSRICVSFTSSILRIYKHR